MFGLGIIEAIITAGTKIGSELIEDKDKKTEFAFKMQEVSFKYMDTLINKDTYKWVDAVVKLSYASEQIVKGLIRPIGSFILVGIATYCSIKGVELPEVVQYILYGAPAAWGVSRHVEKAKSK